MLDNLVARVDNHVKNSDDLKDELIALKKMMGDPKIDHESKINSRQDAEDYFQQVFKLSPEESAKIGDFKKQQMIRDRRFELQKFITSHTQEADELKFRTNLLRRYQEQLNCGNIISHKDPNEPTTLGQTDPTFDWMAHLPDLDYKKLIKNDALITAEAYTPFTVERVAGYHGSYTPGSIPFLRNIITHGEKDSSVMGTKLVYASRPVFIARSLTRAISETDAPTDISQIRLPFDFTFVIFADPIPIPSPRSILYNEEDDFEEFFDINAGIFGGLCSPDAKILGIFFQQQEELSDYIQWIIQSPTLDGKELTLTSAPGQISRSLLAPLILNTAALVSIKTLTTNPTQFLPLPDDKKELKHLKKTKAYQKNLQRGNYSGVRVIDLAQHENAGSSTYTDSTGRKVKAHWRRGHYRHQRCGPRSSYWTELRFIHPQWIEGKAQPSGEQVWKASQ